jgi:hypothetical protein
VRKATECEEDAPYDSAFKELVNELGETILSKNKSVTTLSQIKADFLAKLSKCGSEEGKTVYSWKLKAKLQQHFKDKLVFVERRGHSDLVCSSTVTVGDALRKASELYDIQLSDTIEDMHDLNSEPSEMDERQILHSAANILR